MTSAQTEIISKGIAKCINRSLATISVAWAHTLLAKFWIDWFPTPSVSKGAAHQPVEIKSYLNKENKKTTNKAKGNKANNIIMHSMTIYFPRIPLTGFKQKTDPRNVSRT